MDWINTAFSFLKTHSLNNGYNVALKEGAIYIDQEGDQIEINECPNSRSEWQNRISHLEKEISKVLSGNPIVFRTKECNADNGIEREDYYRLSFGLFLNSGTPIYRYYVLYKNKDRIITPSVDHFEELVTSGKLLDIDEDFTMDLKEIEIFLPTMDVCVTDYIKNLDLAEQKGQKRRDLKNLAELYNSKNKNNRILYGITDDNAPINEQREIELIKQKQAIQRLYERSVIIKPLSFGNILSSTPPYDE